jgi:nitroreductase
MDLFDAIAQRASVRTFARSSISDGDLEKIVDAGRRAPSGYNRQPWEFIVVRDRQIMERLGKIQSCIADAAAAVAVVMDEGASKYWKEDAGAAIENMLLASVALGYSSLWVEGYVLMQEEYGKSVLKVPESRRLLAILPIGKAISAPRQAAKKPLSEVIHHDVYGGRAAP